MTVGLFSEGIAGEGSFVDEIKSANERFDTRAVPLARQVTEETVLAKEEYRGGPFRVLARKKSIERYQCSRCHTGKPVTAAQGLELTHGNIALAHGTEGQGLSCIDCHHAQDREYLEDKKGRKIDFDHSYQLCGQCHFRQKRDWLGGAHGKRVSNWAGDRVVFNCTSCHNPHSPRFAKRFPATYSVPLD
jgi:ribosomal protein S27AE